MTMKTKHDWLWLALCCAACSSSSSASGPVLSGVVTMRAAPDWFAPPDRLAVGDYENDRQRNVHIQFSYMRAHSEVEWLVFVSGECGVVERAYDFVRCFEIEPRMESPTHGLPFLNHLMRRARFVARRSTTHLLYLNADVVVTGDLVAGVRNVTRQVAERHVLISGYARAFRARRHYDWADAGHRREFAKAVDGAREYEEPGWGMESFIVDRDSLLLQRLPPFLVGRVRWDNWMMQFGAAHPAIAAVDASAALRPVHLEHGGSDAAPKAMGAMRADAANQYNKELSEAHGSQDWGVMFCFDYVVRTSGRVEHYANLGGGNFTVEGDTMPTKGSAAWTDYMARKYGKWQYERFANLRRWIIGKKHIRLQ